MKLAPSGVWGHLDERLVVVGQETSPDSERRCRKSSKRHQVLVQWRVGTVVEALVREDTPSTTLHAIYWPSPLSSSLGRTESFMDNDCRPALPSCVGDVDNHHSCLSSNGSSFAFLHVPAYRSTLKRGIEVTGGTKHDRPRLYFPLRYAGRGTNSSSSHHRLTSIQGWAIEKLCIPRSPEEEPGWQYLPGGHGTGRRSRKDE